MASWRAPGSILEAPGLDFGGSWVDFSEIFGYKNHKRQKPAKKGHRSQICQTAKGGWAAVIPPGGFQSAAHRRCAGRAKSQLHCCQPKLQIYHKWPSSWWQAQVLRSRLLDPSLFLSPGAWGWPPTLRQEAEKWDFVDFFFDFLPFQVAI